MPPDKLSAGAAENAPEILPGLVLAVATWVDEELGFLPYSSIAALNSVARGRHPVG